MGLSVDSPRHTCVWHVLLCVANPWQPGWRHWRARSCSPPPQETLQGPHWDHSPHASSSAGHRKGRTSVSPVGWGSPHILTRLNGRQQLTYANEGCLKPRPQRGLSSSPSGLGGGGKGLSMLTLWVKSKSLPTGNKHLGQEDCGPLAFPP